MMPRFPWTNSEFPVIPNKTGNRTSEHGTGDIEAEYQLVEIIELTNIELHSKYAPHGAPQYMNRQIWDKFELYIQ